MNRSDAVMQRVGGHNVRRLWNRGAQGYLLLALTLWCVPAGWAQVHSTILNISPNITSGCTFSTLGINASGEVVGDFRVNCSNFNGLEEQGYLYSGGVFKPFDVAPACNLCTYASAINDSGQIAGSFLDTNGVSHGFLLSAGGSLTTFDPPGSVGAGTYVTGVNASGQIVGLFSTADSIEHGFLYSKGSFKTIDGPGAFFVTSVDAINASGQMAGHYDDAATVSHAFLLSGDIFTSIDVPGAYPGSTSVNGINTSGQVVGSFLDAAHKTHGFLYSGGKGGRGGSFNMIDPPGALYTQPHAINDAGQIVGNFFFGGVTHGFLYAGGKFTTIDAPGASSSLGTGVDAINDSGEMVGTFFDAAGNKRAFVATTDPCVDAGGDSDGDGLCDDWEKNGLFVNVNGNSVFLDLPAMGADPNHQDIFVQLDHLGDGISQAALNVVIAAFANAPVSNPDGTTGITLHVDNGPSSIMNPVTGAIWGDLSLAASISDVANLGTFDAIGDFNWSTFDAEKHLDFRAERAPAFHYAISEPVVIYYPDGNNNASGLSRGIPSNDFIVALPAYAPYNGAGYLGGTFMHELGHNLGLGHGGGDGINTKPNYLSVMNYAFQFPGLQPGNIYDYSRFGQDSDPSHLMPVLDEAHLDEATGLGTSSEPVGANALRYNSVRYCPNDQTTKVIINGFNQPIDWDCNQVGNQDDNATDIAAAGVNGDASGAFVLLKPYDDWAHLIFKGGGIGSLSGAPLPSTTQNIEPTVAQLQDFADFWAAQRKDNIPPATTVTLSPQPNAAGWNNSNVTVTLRAFDNSGGSGVKQISYSATGAQGIANTIASGASTVIPLTVEGQTSITYFATDIAGNAESAHTLVVKIDKTPPTIAGSKSPQPNAAGWNNTNVAVSFACADLLSGLAAGSPPPAIVISSEGRGNSASGSCTDVAGNSATATVANINIDKTPPMILAVQNPPPNSNGWNNTTVTVSFTASDTLSGVALVSSPVSVSTQGSGQSVVGSATDVAGNSASTALSLNIDETPPEVLIQFDPSTRDLAVFGLDTLSGVPSGKVSPTTIVAAREKERRDGDSRDDDGGSELRTYDAVDLAGNTLVVVEEVRKEAHRLTAHLVSLRYNNGAALQAAPNEQSFEWDFERDGSLESLRQEIEIGDHDRSQRMEASAKYDERKGRTIITTEGLGPDREITKSGLALLRITTAAGKVRLEF